MKVQQYGNAAVVTYRSTDHGTYNGKDISGQYRRDGASRWLSSMVAAARG
jgi:hypothetical protein